MEDLIAKAAMNWIGHVARMNIERLAQDRKGWKRKVGQAWPTRKMKPRLAEALDAWRPGMRLPEGDEGGMAVAPVRGNAEIKRTESGFICPVCEEVGDAIRLQRHYDRNIP